VTKASPAVVVATVVCAAVVSAFPASVAYSTVATASKKNPVVQGEPIIRKMIVKLRNPKAIELEQPLGPDRVTALSNRAGVALQAHRAMAMGASVLRLDTPMKLSEARTIAARLAADPEVLYAEPDMPMRLMAVPPDPSFALRQWNLFDPNSIFSDNNTQNTGPAKNFTPIGAMNLPAAWDITTGSSSIVVAVIDNGVTLTHPELAAAVLPGMDMVSANAGGLPTNFVANDGNGRDTDPTDPGDWSTTADNTNFPNACDAPPAGKTQIDSSWHGTHMAGAIAGQWGNSGPGTSTAGIAPGVRLLPVRALGKCGGDSSDVADAILWAAGLPVPGVATNSTPARIISMSLGGTGPCSTTYNGAIQAVATQALVIAAAGNEAKIGVDEPANCPGALAVTAHTINGDNADYANVGPEVGISSPGGGKPVLLQTNAALDTDNGFYTWSSILFGATTPTSTETGGTRTGPAIGGFTGTSGATANVSGVAALVLSAKPTLTPAELRNVLVTHTRPHPAGGYCTVTAPGQCGTGLIDAASAVASVVPAPPRGGGGGGGALPLAQLLLLGLFAFVAHQRRRG
jgi:serine protease